MCPVPQLFTTGIVSSDGNGDVSRNTVKTKLKELVAAEDKKKPGAMNSSQVFYRMQECRYREEPLPSTGWSLELEACSREKMDKGNCSVVCASCCADRKKTWAGRIKNPIGAAIWNGFLYVTVRVLNSYG